MTQAEYQTLLESFNALDLFASQTPLQRGWHANWQAIYGQLVTKAQAMVEKPADNGKAPPAK